MFELFEAETLPESGLLAALGVVRSEYMSNEHITRRVLKAIEGGRLSEAGLIKILG